jgi:3-oxoacyl-[acyl-carrier protein] reductase
LSKNDLVSKLVVVTSGSNGIGAATVRAFAELSATVVVGYHSSEKRALDLIDSLPGTGHPAVRLDLTTPVVIIL